MVLCEWDVPEGDPRQSCVHLFARRRLSAQFQFSLSAVTLGYLSQCLIQTGYRCVRAHVEYEFQTGHMECMECYIA